MSCIFRTYKGVLRTSDYIQKVVDHLYPEFGFVLLGADDWHLSSFTFHFVDNAPPIVGFANNAAVLACDDQLVAQLI